MRCLLTVAMLLSASPVLAEDLPEVHIRGRIERPATIFLTRKRPSPEPEELRRSFTDEIVRDATIPH